MLLKNLSKLLVAHGFTIRGDMNSLGDKYAHRDGGPRDVRLWYWFGDYKADPTWVVEYSDSCNLTKLYEVAEDVCGVRRELKINGRIHTVFRLWKTASRRFHDHQIASIGEADWCRSPTEAVRMIDGYIDGLIPEGIFADFVRDEMLP